MIVRILHNLKIKYLYAKAIVSGDKTFELRKDDRDFQVGDYIAFEIVDLPCLPGPGKESEEIVNKVNTLEKFFDSTHFEITYKLNGVPEYGLMPGYCILGIKPRPFDNKNDAIIKCQRSH